MNAEARQNTQRPLGRQMMEDRDIPQGIKAAAESKLPDGAKVVPAREDGGYKGKVIYSNERYLVQTVGAKQENAVVHRKEDLQMMGQKLEWREKNGMLNNVNVQIHYSGDKGKAYVWNQEREQAARAEQGRARESGAPTDRAKPASESIKESSAMLKDSKPAQDLNKLAPSKGEAIDRIGLRLNYPGVDLKAIAGVPADKTLPPLKGQERQEAEDRMTARKEAKSTGDVKLLKELDAQVKEREPVAVKQRAAKAQQPAEIER